MASVMRQRGEADCAIAALATLAPYLSYDALIRAGAAVEPRWQGRRGFLNREVVDLAARVGIILRRTKRYNLDRDEGLLRFYRNLRDARAKAIVNAHFVCVKRGKILDPADGSATPWRAYVATQGVTL